jgi:hypothetical protein
MVTRVSDGFLRCAKVENGVKYLTLEGHVESYINLNSRKETAVNMQMLWDDDEGL